MTDDILTPIIFFGMVALIVVTLYAAKRCIR